MEVSESIQFAGVLEDCNFVIAADDFKKLTPDRGYFRPQRLIQLMITAAKFQHQCDGCRRALNFNVYVFLAHAIFVNGKVFWMKVR